ncbi:MAG: TMEM165/GDT1 family protein [Oscillospiraceae bacterium]|jgi:putative Ca2+/H+ antiporter (TMEM165/GDT1 family)|nr:TMEM165/GDT1 family protein [Oscillospiraceae bacterium]
MGFWGASLFAVGAVVLAEMGDKTQLLAMAFATRYKASRVMLGVLLATLLNHGLAVAAGALLAGFDDIRAWIQLIAALSFIFFGLWTLRGDKLDGEDARPSRFGPVLTVGLAFFAAEMGDKTQLATIAIAARYPAHPLGVLLGTTAGMLIADGVGILVGVALAKRIPERTVKLISAGAFILFGFIGSYQAARGELGWSPEAALAGLAALFAITAAAVWRLLRKGG